MRTTTASAASADEPAHRSARAFDQAIALKPDYLEALVNKASMLGALQHFDEVLSALDKVIALNPNIPEVWANRASALIALKRHDQAVESYTRAVTLRPSYADAEEPRRGATMLGRPQEALECFEKIRPRRQQSGGPQKRRRSVAHAQAQQGRGGALRKLSRAQAGRHQRLGNGVALVESERYSEGLEAFDKAVALDPSNADAWNHRGNVLFQLKRYDEAATSYDRALAIAPGLPYCAGYLAQSRLRCCDWSHIEEDRARVAAGRARAFP